jgi:hypothetical protein
MTQKMIQKTADSWYWWFKQSILGAGYQINRNFSVGADANYNFEN